MCSKDLLQMSSTKQNNSKISSDDSEQYKIDTSAETRSSEIVNEADKHLQNTLLGFTKFVHGLDSYGNIVYQKSKWSMNLNVMSKM